MKKLSKKQIEDLIMLSKGFKNHLFQLNEMSTQTDSTRILNKIENCKKGVLEHIKEFNENIIDRLKKENYDVSDDLYIRLSI